MKTRKRSRLLGVILAAIMLWAWTVPVLASPGASAPAASDSETMPSQTEPTAVTHVDLQQQFSTVSSETRPTKPAKTYNIWRGDNVKIVLPTEEGFTTYWHTSDTSAGFYELIDTMGPEATVEELVSDCYLAVMLKPDDADKKPLYGAYLLRPFGLTGITVRAVEDPSADEKLDLSKVPFGTELQLQADLQLQDLSGGEISAKADADTGAVSGKLPRYTWTRDGAALPDDTKSAITVDTTSQSCLTGKSYACTVSGLPSLTANESTQNAAQTVTVLTPAMTLPATVAEQGLDVEIGSEGTVELSWNGTVAADADLTGVTVTALATGSNASSAPELQCVPTASGVHVASVLVAHGADPAVYEYTLQVNVDGTSVSTVPLRLNVVRKAAKATSISASPNAVAVGQGVELKAAVVDAVEDTTYQWLQSPPGETYTWSDVAGAAGTLSKDATAVPDVAAYPAADTVYTLRLGTRLPAAGVAPAQVYAFTLGARDGVARLGGITGLSVPLQVTWISDSSAEADAPTAPVSPPKIEWTKADSIAVDSKDSMLASVQIPAAQTAPIEVSATYAADKDAPASAAVKPVVFSVQPVVLQAGNSSGAFTFPDKVPTGNPVGLPVQWSSAPANAQGVRISWSIAEKPDGSAAAVPSTTVAPDGTLAATSFTPDVAGTYKLKAAAHTGTSYTSGSQVGGSGVEITLVAEVIQAGQARITASPSTRVAIGDPVSLQAQIADSSGVFKDPTAASAGKWKIVLPDGTTETPAGSDNGNLMYRPKSAGDYKVTYTPTATGSIPASITITATDPSAPAVTPSVSLEVLQNGEAAPNTVPAGTGLTAVISVKDLPAAVTSVTGTIQASGFGAAAASRSFQIETDSGAGSTDLTYTVPQDVMDGQSLRLEVSAAQANVTGVSVDLPAAWSAKAAASNSKPVVQLIASDYATVNEPFSVTLKANVPLDVTKTQWTTGAYGNITSNSSSTVTFTPTSPGSVTVGVSVVTPGGQGGFASKEITVGSDFRVTLDGPATVEAGKAVTVTALPSTSNPAVGLDWTVDPAYSYSRSGQSITFTPDKTGTVKVQVRADLGTKSETADLSVRVSEPATPSASPSPDGSSSPSPSPSASAGASSSASPSPTPSASPSASPSPSASGSAPTAVNTLLRLRSDSNLRLTVRNLECYVEGIKIVPKASQLMSAAELKAEFVPPARGSIRVANMNGETDKESDPVGSGVAVQLLTADGQLAEEATVLVMGDVLGTGLINIAQLVRMAKDLNGSQVLLGVFRMAGDWNGSGAVDIADLVREAQVLNGTA